MLFVLIGEISKTEVKKFKFMDTIYSDARQVAVWLGPATENNTVAIHYLLHGHVVANDSLARYIQCMEELASRPWWFRIWVVQEVSFLRLAVILCGQDA